MSKAEKMRNRLQKGHSFHVFSSSNNVEIISQDSCQSNTSTKSHRNPLRQLLSSFNLKPSIDKQTIGTSQTSNSIASESKSERLNNRVATLAGDSKKEICQEEIQSTPEITFVAVEDEKDADFTSSFPSNPSRKETISAMPIIDVNNSFCHDKMDRTKSAPHITDTSRFSMEKTRLINDHTKLRAVRSNDLQTSTATYSFMNKFRSTDHGDDDDESSNTLENSNVSSVTSNHSIASMFVTSRTRSPSSQNLHIYMCRVSSSASSPELHNEMTVYNPNEISRPAVKRLSFDDLITRITDFLFIGSIEGSYNERLLCNYNINRIVDVSNTPSDKFRKTKSSCHCAAKKHYRAKLCLTLEDNELERVESFFDEINIFINTARQAGYRVLIASYHGKSRCTLVASQYLMAFGGMNLTEAFTSIKKLRPTVTLNVGFRQSLERWERHCRMVKELAISQAAEENLS